MDSQLLGYILSGSSTEEAFFQPLEAVEDTISEGMLVAIGDDESFYAIVAGIEYRSDLYEPNSIWLESIRRGYRPPEEASRPHSIARLRIIGRMRSGELYSPDRPPKPGSPVYKLGRRQASMLYGFSLGDELPDKYITIGGLYGYNISELPAILDLSAITMHLAVIGVTGSGKSNTVGIIVEELGSKEGIGRFRTIPVFIVDANGDYIDYYEHPELVPAYERIYRFVFPSSEAATLGYKDINGRNSIEPLLLDLNVFEPDELAELITLYYQGGRIDSSEKQAQLIQDALAEARRPSGGIRACLHEGVVDYNCLLGSPEGLEALEEAISEKSHDYHSATVAAALRAVRLFYRRFSEEQGIVPGSRAKARLGRSFVDEATRPTRPFLVIIDFSAEGATSVSLDIKQLVVYYLLKLLFQAFTEYRVKGIDRLALFVLEEAQNYAPNLSAYPVGFSLARRILATVATQGRKFGLSLALVTQRPSYVDPVVMSMMNTFIIHRVAPRDTGYVEQATGGLPAYISRKLPVLEKGVAVLAGQMNAFPVPILARIRRRKLHRAGGDILL